MTACKLVRSTHASHRRRHDSPVAAVLCMVMRASWLAHPQPLSALLRSLRLLAHGVIVVLVTSALSITLLSCAQFAVQQVDGSSEVEAVVQAPPELLAWMRQFGFKPDAIEAVAELRFDVPPTVAVTEANVRALEDVLQMSDAQVCLATACRNLHRSCTTHQRM